MSLWSQDVLAYNCLWRYNSETIVPWRSGPLLSELSPLARPARQIFIPTTTDVYEKKNMPKVVYCIHALSLFAFKLGRAPQMLDLLGKAVFTGGWRGTDVRRWRPSARTSSESSGVGLLLPSETCTMFIVTVTFNVFCCIRVYSFICLLNFMFFNARRY